MPSSSKPLGEVLVEERLISREQLAEALERQSETGRPLGTILREAGLVEEKSLVEAVAKQIGVPFVDLETRPPDPSVVELIPVEFATAKEVLPVRLDGNALVVAMTHPANRVTVQALAEMTGYEIVPALAVRRDVLHAIERIASGDIAPTYEEEVLQEMVAPLEHEPEDKELNMNILLERVLDEGASDLHLTAHTQPT
ncbi:MAG: GspE/PulE family protein, partial [Actinomycetota bacterium]